MKRHVRDNYLVEKPEGRIYSQGQDIYSQGQEPQLPSAMARLRKFQFSRMVSQADEPLDKCKKKKLLIALAEAMTAVPKTPDSADPSIPAGFTFLAQFIAHDLSFDKTSFSLGENVTVEEMIQGRSPALDLDSLYGRGPGNIEDAKLYCDGIRLKTGTTAAVRSPAMWGRLADTPMGLAPLEEVQSSPTNVDLDGFDLPRIGMGSTKSERRRALIPDPRNDENLGVAQTHLAFIRFHNRVVDKLAREGVPQFDLFNAAREVVVKHYQWMIRKDFLPRIVDETIVNDVFKNGRKFFETEPPPGSMPTMPIEFSVAAYRFGHSMIAPAYQWNRVYCTAGQRPAWLRSLFRLSGMSGTLSPLPRGADPDDPETGEFERLPTDWIADFRRLYDFGDPKNDDLKKENIAPPGYNIAKRIDTLLTDSLAELPLSALSWRATKSPESYERNLAYRTLARAQMVKLASGQQMAEAMKKKFLNIAPLKPDEILNGKDGAKLDNLTPEQRDDLLAETPPFFYILREAELNGGRLTGVGGRIVAEVFHRAMEGSQVSIVRNPFWEPTLGPNNKDFRMVDLLLFAFEGRAELLHPLDFLGR